jgi:phosphatidylserine synthase
MQLDSLCDLVVFGVAPALIGYNYSLYQYKIKGKWEILN